MEFPHIFSPYRVKNTVFRNRIMAAPNGTKHKTPEGFPQEFEIAVFESRAKGGSAQVTTGSARVTNKYSDQARSKSLDLENPDGQPALTEVALAIRRHGAVASIELNHSGPLSVPANSGGRLPVGPTAYVRSDGISVSEMDGVMIAEAIEDFGKAAAFAKQCYFETCMIHGGHGWLVSSFLSPKSNTRTDEWGGSPENRVRLAVEICKRIREMCGDGFLIEFRLTGDEFASGGITAEDAVIYAKLLEDHIDILHVSASGISTAHHNPNEAINDAGASAIWENCPTPHILQQQGCYVHLADAIKKSGVKTPIVTVGAITTPEMAEEIIASGKADFVAMARALIADPDLPRKAKRGCRDDIIPCIRCEKCNDRHVTRQCTVNPQMGRFIRQLYMNRTPTPQKVAIIGGGPGGMQAAITAAEQGHDVTLYEKSGALGGLLTPLSKEFLKREMVPYRDYLTKKATASAKIILNTEATADILKRENYEYIIAAVGGIPIIPNIPGSDSANILSAIQIRDECVSLGKTVSVIGGGMAGCEIAYELAEEGHKVMLIERLATLFPARDRVSRNYSMPIFVRLIAHENVTIHTNTQCLSFYGKEIRLKKDNNKFTAHSDTVIMAVGVKPNCSVVDSLWGTAPEFRAVGDCLNPGTILSAVSEAYFAAMDI